MNKLSNVNPDSELTLDEQHRKAREAVKRIEVLVSEISSQKANGSRKHKEEEILSLFKEIYDGLPRELETILPRKKQTEYIEGQRKDSHAKRGVVYIPGGNLVLKILRKTALPGSSIYRNDVLTSQRFENDPNFSVARIHDVFRESDPQILLRDRMSVSRELKKYHPEIQQFIPGITLSEAALPLKKAMANVGTKKEERDRLEGTIAKLKEIVINKVIPDIFYFHQHADPLVTRANETEEFRQIPVDSYKINERSVSDLIKSVRHAFTNLVMPSNNKRGLTIIEQIEERKNTYLDDLNKQTNLYGRIVDSVPDNIILRLSPNVLEELSEKDVLKTNDVDSLLGQVEGVTHVDLNGYRYGNVAEDLFNIVDSFPLRATMFGKNDEEAFIEQKLGAPAVTCNLYGTHRAARRANVLIEYARRLNETQKTRSNYSAELKNYKKQVVHHYKRAASRLERAIELGLSYDLYSPLVNAFENFSEFSEFLFERQKK